MREFTCTFAHMQSNDNSFEKILSNLQIDSLNEMQQQAIAALENSNEVILLSSTGSGKTLAFLLPILKDLTASPNTTRALVIVPSRELALQIEKVFEKEFWWRKVTTPSLKV